MRCLGCMKEIPDNEKICSLCGYDQSLPAKEPYHMSPGTILGDRYLIGRVLGYGGFGVTYIGYDNILSHTVAIKEYLPGEFSTRMPGDLKITVYSGEKHEQFVSGKAKFLDEAKRLAKFRNIQGIVEIYDVFEMNDTSYIIMEYLEGETIRNRLDRCGVFSPEEAAELLKPVMEALTHVHAEGIIHRDIAPDNIYILTDGKVKILDFGAARYASTNFSKSLSVILKQGYAPEEQYRSRGAQGQWSDVYALAATMYKMITGVTPEDAIERTVNDELQPPSKLGIKLSKNYENALMNALNVYREDRTQSVEEFRNELFASGDVARRANKLHKSDTGKWKKWQKIAVAACGGTALLAALLFFTGVINFNSKNKLDGSVNVLSLNEVYVPDLLGKGVNDAVDITNENGVSFQVIDKQFSMYVDEDRIMLQDPDAGSVGDKTKLMMNVVVSGGKPTTEIENYLGQNAEDVKKLLEKAGIVVEIKEEKSSLTNGTVIRQSVEDGTLLKADEKIILTVSKNDSSYDESIKHAISDFVGKNADDISSIEFSDKYTFDIVTEFSDTVEKNIIFAQDPPAGTQLAEGGKITLKVSKGSEKITVPDTQYKSQEEAVKLLTDAGLKADVQQEESDVVAEGHITRQNTAAGTKVSRGETVVIYVSTGSGSSAQQEEQPQQEAPAEEQPAPAAEEPAVQTTAEKKPEPVRTTAPPETEPPTTQYAAPSEPEDTRVKMGDDIYAEVVDNDLVLSGSGDMYDYSESTHPVFDFTGDIVIGDGITSVGAYAFYGSGATGNVICSGSVKNIGYSAFSQSSISAFIAYSGLETISNSAFYGCNNLSSVRLPYGTNYSEDGSTHSYIFDTIDPKQVTITN